MAYIKFLKDGDKLDKSFPPVSIALNKKIKILTYMAVLQTTVIVSLLCIRFLL